MIPKDKKKYILSVINEAVKNGARKSYVANELELCLRTLQRWDKSQEDLRQFKTSEPKNKLSKKEREEVIKICTSEEFVDLSPHQIVPILAERGQYIASESTFYRILRENAMVTPKKQPLKSPRHKPESLKATGPNQVWSWDITYLKTDLKGEFLYLYLFMDVWSRKIVAWDIFDRQTSENASEILRNCERVNLGETLRLHSDNGAPMKGRTFLSTLQQLGVVPSFSRPRCSNDNPYSESLFKTLKYNDGCPKNFSSEDRAKVWVKKFVHWYNTQHRHSGIGYVTPEQRDTKKDIALLKRRNKTMLEAREKNPIRFSKNKIRQWVYQEVVYLNPDKDEFITEKTRHSA